MVLYGLWSCPYSRMVSSMAKYKSILKTCLTTENKNEQTW